MGAGTAPPNGRPPAPRRWPVGGALGGGGGGEVGGRGAPGPGGGRQRRLSELEEPRWSETRCIGHGLNRQNRGCCGVSEESGMCCSEQRQTEH